MKQELDREIDALLRAHKRRDDEVASRTNDAHMDADEVNAYAQGALPAAARALYVPHLADCVRCRRLVTRAVLASGSAHDTTRGEVSERQRVVAETTTVATAQSPRSAGWRAWFTPRAWRLAAPFAALLVFGVTLFVVLRPAHDDARIASSPAVPSSPMQPAPGDAASTTATNNANAAASTTTAASTDSAREAATDTNQSPSGGLLARNQSASPPPPPSLPPSSTAGNAARDDSEITTTRAPREAKSVAAPNPPPTVAASTTASAPASVAADRPTTDESIAPVEPLPVNGRAVESLSVNNSAQDEQARRDGRTVTDAGGDQKTANAKRRPDPTLNQTQSRNDGRIAKEVDEVVRTGGNQRNAPRARSMRRAPNAPAPPARDAAPEPEAAGKEEMRSVAGRRFRRQEGGAWIDTAYTHGQSTVNVRRGSEQYRALVADEPELRRIAEVLSGEVVVVSRGRAYRLKP